MNPKVLSFVDKVTAPFLSFADKIAAPFIPAAHKLTKLCAPLARYLQAVLLLAIRVCWGKAFVMTGHGKLTNLDKITSYFADLHIPAPRFNAELASVTEYVGGALLFVGLGSRLAALMLTCTMTVAYITTEQDALNDLFHHGDPSKFAAADPFPFLLTSLVVLAFGPGLFSLDWLIGKRWGLRNGAKNAA